jgi:NarL family two-component system response regulator YdfI
LNGLLEERAGNRAGVSDSGQACYIPQTDSTLTERELEVLQLAAKGERNKEIAYKLGITVRTVKAHLQSIYQKFGMDSRAAAGNGLLDA